MKLTGLNGGEILAKAARAVQEAKDYLSEIDGLIADGDHGVNMNKGFTMFLNSIEGRRVNLAEGLDELGNLLLGEIGGSMGPIYGSMFMAMAEAAEDTETLSAASLAAMLQAGLDGIHDVTEAQPGDKTLVDTLAAAIESAEASAEAGHGLALALAEMKAAAKKGCDSTKDMVARFGRSSRLGERSRGVLDAGASSCCTILCALADGVLEQLETV